MKIVVNGWDLKTHAADPHSLFALEWLSGLASARPDLELSFAIPKLGKQVVNIEGMKTLEFDVHASALGQIHFEQRQLVKYARLQEADVLVYPTGGGPILSATPVVTFPLAQSLPAERSFGGRLAWAAGNAGQLGADGKIGWQEPGEKGEVEYGPIRLPAWVSSRFNPLKEPSDLEVLARYSLKPGYLLAWLQDPNSLGRILEVWRWLTDTIDPGGPLVLIGESNAGIDAAQDLITRLALNDWVRTISGVSLDDLPSIFRQAACYFHGAPSRSGQELRWAMASGLPVAGIETPLSSTIMGEAGYLASSQDVRSLVAACITVIVEPQMADELRKRGLKKARQYHHDHIFDALVEILRGVRLR